MSNEPIEIHSTVRLLLHAPLFYLYYVYIAHLVYNYSSKKKFTSKKFSENKLVLQNISEFEQPQIFYNCSTHGPLIYTISNSKL